MDENQMPVQAMRTAVEVEADDAFRNGQPPMEDDARAVALDRQAGHARRRRHGCQQIGVRIKVRIGVARAVRDDSPGIVVAVAVERVTPALAGI